MKYLIWHKFVYLILIAVGFITVFLGTFKMGNRIGDPQVLYIPILNFVTTFHTYITSLLLPGIFFFVHIFIFEKHLSQSMTRRIYCLEWILSLGRMAMCGMMLFLPKLSYSTIVLLSPVANSLWKWVRIYLIKISFLEIRIFYIFCVLLLVGEILYLFLLVKKKDDLGKLNSVSPIIKNNLSSVTDGFFGSLSRFWQLKVGVIFGVLSLTVLTCSKLLVLGGIIDPLAMTKTIELYEKKNEKNGKTYTLQIPSGYYLFLNLPVRNHYTSLRPVYSGKNSQPEKDSFGFYDKKALKEFKTVEVSINNFGPGTFKGLDVENPNDRGRNYLDGFLAREIKHFKKVPVKEDIEGPAKIEKYTSTRKGKRFVDMDLFVIKHDNKRISVVTCYTNKTCSGHTTWKDKLGIFYRKKKLDLSSMIHLDRSVISLVDSFKPTLKQG